MEDRDVFARYSQKVLDRAFEQYESQKQNAESRNIEFLLSFRQWLEWWGDDLFRRGRGAKALQMQRFLDQGPYALWNIKKGTPAQNSKTAANMARKRKTDAAKARVEALLDAAMWAPSAEALPERTEDEEELGKLGMRSSRSERYFYVG